MTDWVTTEITKLIAEYGDIPPPWVIFPGEHPYSMCWRMGYGDSYVPMWSKWWRVQNFSETQRIAYFRKWTPPHAWLKWAIAVIWDLHAGEEDVDVDYTLYFERTAALGFGSQQDYEIDSNDPKWLGAEADDDPD
jgi:hypothetical protein